jgi:hypothetical protein
MILADQRRIWTFYVLTVSAMVGSATVASGGQLPGGRPWLFLGIQGAVLLVCLGLTRLPLRGWRAAILIGSFSIAGLMAVFLSLGLVLPAAHPEPFEWRWLQADRALFGVDPTVWLQRILWPPFTEVMQVCYAAFYLVPIAAVIAVGIRSGLRAFERAQLFVVFGFQLSYLGYMLWPTLPPYRFLWHERTIEGVWLTGRLHAMIDAAELHRWDCFPSGHTMLSVLSLWLAWRHARPAFWVLLTPVAILVLSTVALRYHFVMDVLAGLAGVPVAVWLGNRVFTTRASDTPAIGEPALSP